MESLSQSKEPFDVVVVDDGSTPALDVSRFRVHLIRLPCNGGPVEAANVGLEWILRQGYDYMARNDAGDLSSSERLARQVTYLDQHPACMLVGSDVDVFNGEGQYQFTLTPPRNGKTLASSLIEHSWLLHSSLMFRASVFAEVGPYSAEFPAAEDHELCLRIGSKYPIAVVPERLVSMICSETGISIMKRRIQLISRLRLQLRYFRWTSPRSYRGIIKCLISLSLPLSFVRWLKRKYIYSRVGETALNHQIV